MYSMRKNGNYMKRVCRVQFALWRLGYGLPELFLKKFAGIFPSLQTGNAYHNFIGSGVFIAQLPPVHRIGSGRRQERTQAKHVERGDPRAPGLKIQLLENT